MNNTAITIIRICSSGTPPHNIQSSANFTEYRSFSKLGSKSSGVVNNNRTARQVTTIQRQQKQRNGDKARGRWHHHDQLTGGGCFGCCCAWHMFINKSQVLTSLVYHYCAVVVRGGYSFYLPQPPSNPV